MEISIKENLLKFQKEILELKSTMIEMKKKKNLLQGFKGKCEQAERSISDLKTEKWKSSNMRNRKQKD